MSKQNPHDPKKYLEFRVEVKGWDGDKPVFSLKVPTDRKSVSISDNDAKIMNQSIYQYGKGFWYERLPQPGKPKEEKPEAEKPATARSAKHKK